MACCIQQCPGVNRCSQVNNAPQVTQTCDVANRYSQQVVDNRNDIYVNQPVINNRDHYVNNVNTQVVRDNNFYHYRQQHYFRDNTINRNFNRIVRQQANFSDFSCSSCILPGTCTSIDCGTTYACC